MDGIRVTIHGDRELVARLRRFGVDILDLSDSMEESGDYLTRFFSGEVFASRGRVIGEPWPPLNTSYATLKARLWPGRPPLIRTGLMQRSFRHKATKLTSSLWNEAAYFDYHQEGAGVPQRVMMKMDRQRTNRVVQFIAGDIESKMRRAGV